MIPDRTTQGKRTRSKKTQGGIDTFRTEKFECILVEDSISEDGATETQIAAWREAIGSLIDELGDSLPGWTKVKESTVRTIYRGQWHEPDGAPLPVHLKLFRAVRLSDRARDAIAGSRSTRELHNLRAAAERGLPSVRPIAAGKFAGTCGSRSFLLTHTETGEPLPRTPLDSADAEAAGRLLRLAHDRGLHARDLHPGNILKRPDGSLVLLDLTSAAFGDPLDDRQRGRALAFFCLDLDGNVRDPAARPLVHAYGANRATLEFAASSARRLRNRSLSAFGRRAFRSCRTTEIERASRRPRVYLHVPTTESWNDARSTFAQLNDPDQERVEPIKSGRRGAVYLIGGLAIKKRTAAAARRLFESAYWLTYAGVPTPRPIALETFQSQGMIATEQIPHPNLLTDLDRGLADDPAALLACAQDLGRSVGRLHSFGLRNRDMKFENLIRDPNHQTIYTVDLDGVRRQPPGDNRGRASDLGRLLAAFEHAGRPGGDPVLRAFLRSYIRTCHQLLLPVAHRHFVLQQATTNARTWAKNHA